MQRLDVVGPFRGNSGYDRHTREFVRQFLARGVEVGLKELSGWSLPADRQDPVLEKLPDSVHAEMTLHFTMPNQVHSAPGVKHVNYTMFEASGISGEWVSRAAEHDLIVLPTESSRLAWANSGVPEHKLRICPLGVDGTFFSDTASPLELRLPDGRPISSFSHRFLNIGELRPRKNHLGLLRAWINATSADDDAVLLIKGTVFAPRVLGHFQEDVAMLAKWQGKTLADAAPAVFLHDTYTDAEILSLYKSATCYVSMSMGEGWDLVMIEAAASGLQVIAPRHSAYVAYLRDDDTHFIPATLVPAEFEGRRAGEDSMFFSGLSWWQPDESAAAAIIRAIVDGTADKKPCPGPRLIDEFSWDRAGTKLLDTLHDFAGTG